MRIHADYLSQTTEPHGGMVAYADALNALRIGSHVLITEEYAPPWGVAVPKADELRELLRAGANSRVVPFHLVRRGAFELRVAGQRSRIVNAGELVLVPSGAAHRLSEGAPAKVAPLTSILAGARIGRDRAPSTALVCGAFVMHDVRFNPLFAALPPVLQVSVADARATFVARGVVELLTAEVTGARRTWVVSRLLEVLCGEVLLSADGEAGSARWLRAVHDGSVGAALGALHQHPGEAWTVARLAKHASLSPSRFAARFRELLHESPMSYVTAWRMATAARRLRESDDRVEAIGQAVGYESLASFSKAFKRQWGVAPSALRTASSALRTASSAR